MFLANVLDRDVRDAIVSQLCSVIMPPIFLYVFLLHFIGEKLAERLLRKDCYNEKRIKVRMFAILRVTGMCLFFIFLIVYFSLYKVWDTAALFVMVLLGYTWIKLRTFFARLEYTYRYLVFCTGKKREYFHWKDVRQMSWVTVRGSVGYALEIQFYSGFTATLSSRDFVGLTKLKNFYDEGYYK